jgi:hypothetical protein
MLVRLVVADHWAMSRAALARFVSVAIDAKVLRV